MMILNKIKILKKARKIKLFASDVDGVLTHGEIIILNSGEEVKIWNVKDGLAYYELRTSSSNVKTAWLTGRKSLQVEKRAENMRIDFLVQDCMKGKKAALEKILQETGIRLDEVAYIGDDIVDLPVLKIVGLSICPKDACKDVKKNVDFVSNLNGGDGVVRQVIEIIMKAKKNWTEALEKYK